MTYIAILLSRYDKFVHLDRLTRTSFSNSICKDPRVSLSSTKKLRQVPHQIEIRKMSYVFGLAERHSGSDKILTLGAHYQIYRIR